MPNTGMRRSATSRIEHAVEVFAAGVQRCARVGCSMKPSRRGSRSAPPTMHQAVEHVEQLLEVVFVGQRRNDDRNAAGCDDRVVVAGGDDR